MTQAVEDGATRPVYYESRVVHLKLDQNTLVLIDSTYDVLEHQSDSATIEKSKKMLGQMESVLGADSTIESLCGDIVVHYEKYRANLLTGKAMIVAYSRTIAMKIYRQILKMRPTWKEKILSLIHISEPTRRTPISYAVFCLKKKKKYQSLSLIQNRR